MLLAGDMDNIEAIESVGLVTERGNEIGADEETMGTLESL